MSTEERNDAINAHCSLIERARYERALKNTADAHEMLRLAASVRRTITTA